MLACFYWNSYGKGVFNLSNQLSNFFKNWGMQRGKTEFHAFHGLILPHFDIHIQQQQKFQQFLLENIFLDISLETMIWGNWYINIADFALKITQNLLETLTPVLSF